MKKQNVDQLFFQLLWKFNENLKAEGTNTVSFFIIKKLIMNSN